MSFSSYGTDQISLPFSRLSVTEPLEYNPKNPRKLAAELKAVTSVISSTGVKYCTDKAEDSCNPADTMPQLNMAAFHELNAAAVKPQPTPIIERHEIFHLEQLLNHDFPDNTVLFIDVDEVLLTVKRDEPCPLGTPIPREYVLVESQSLNDIQSTFDKLKVNCKNLSIIALTNIDMPNLIDRFKKTGIDDSWFDDLLPRSSSQKRRKESKGYRAEQYLLKQKQDGKSYNMVCIVDDFPDNLKSFQRMSTDVCINRMCFHFSGAFKKRILQRIEDSKGHYKCFEHYFETHEEFKNIVQRAEDGQRQMALKTDSLLPPSSAE